MESAASNCVAIPIPKCYNQFRNRVCTGLEALGGWPLKDGIRVASRESALAVAQSMTLVEHLRGALPGMPVTLVTMKTTGDRILDRTLDKVGGKGLFVKELDAALREGRADLTVHSLKDVPMQTPEDLPLLCFSRREDPRDALVLPEGVKALKRGGVIGTSSLRRSLQLKALFPGCAVTPARGNLQTRLRKLDEGQYDALILAAAGLNRLGLSHRISRAFEPEEIIPAAGQGILGVQGRAGEDWACLAGYGDPEATAAALAERAFVRTLDGGCTSPVCAHARVSGGRLALRGLYWDPETGRTQIGEAGGTVSEAQALGEALARRLMKEAGR